MQVLDFLDIQPSPADLISSNTLADHSPYIELLSIGLCPMIVQFGPHGVSFFDLAQDLYLYVWNRREKEAPVVPHASRPD